MDSQTRAIVNTLIALTIAVVFILFVYPGVYRYQYYGSGVLRVDRLTGKRQIYYYKSSEDKGYRDY